MLAVSYIKAYEADVAFGKSNEPAVGDADAMGVGAKIAQGMFRPTEGALRVDDPVLTEQDSEPRCEAAWLSERCEVAVELEPAFVEGGLKTGDELAAEDASEHPDG